MDHTSPESKLVLVVDDEESICGFFDIAFSRAGFRVACSFNGQTAVARLKSKTSKVDLIILDLMMPGYSGYDVLKELQHPDCRNVPIFINTARALDEGTIDMIRLESNVQGFWKKPVDIKDMISKAHEILGTIPKEKHSS